MGQSFWLDEASQAMMSQKTVSEIWYQRSGDFHPPLFYLLAHYWMQVSHSEIWLRILPVIFGVVSIYLIYLTPSPSPKLGEGNSRGEVLDLIQDQGLDASEIARRLNRSASDVGAELTMLMLRGDVEEREGKYFTNNK